MLPSIRPKFAAKFGTVQMWLQKIDFVPPLNSAVILKFPLFSLLILFSKILIYIFQKIHIYFFSVNLEKLVVLIHFWAFFICWGATWHCIHVAHEESASKQPFCLHLKMNTNCLCRSHADHEYARLMVEAWLMRQDGQLNIKKVRGCTDQFTL